MDIFLVKNYGFKVAQQLKIENPKKKDLYRAIIIKELVKTYKYPEAVIIIKNDKTLPGLSSIRLQGKRLHRSPRFRGK